MDNNHYRQFLAAYPQYTETAVIDTLRETQYAILDRSKTVYLDYTGGGLYAESQLDAHHDLLRRNVFGNPHSYNPTSLHATTLVESARNFVLEYFNASSDEYVCIFTQNASGALKIIGESYPFGEGCQYALIFDNHNSVNGIREYASEKGATVQYIPVVLPDLRVNDAVLLDTLQTLDRDRASARYGVGCAFGRSRIHSDQ